MHLQSCLPETLPRYTLKETIICAKIVTSCVIFVVVETVVPCSHEFHFL